MSAVIYNYSTSAFLTNYFIFFSFFFKFIKFNIILSVVFYIFFLTSIENYIKQLIYMNNLTKLFILNENEKEVGPADDFFFFAILFILTICSFIIMSFVVIILNTNIFI
jgi:hypothetical protein